MAYKYSANKWAKVKQWRLDNKEKWKMSYKKSARKIYCKGVDVINELRKQPCFDCGNNYPPYVMEFDHRDPSKKKYTITASKYSLGKSFREELEKCDLVCANCHAVRTHKQRLAGLFKREGYAYVEAIELSGIKSKQIELKLEAI
jgi:hypothetical protein